MDEKANEKIIINNILKLLHFISKSNSKINKIKTWKNLI